MAWLNGMDVTPGKWVTLTAKIGKHMRDLIAPVPELKPPVPDKQCGVMVQSGYETNPCQKSLGHVGEHDPFYRWAKEVKQKPLVMSRDYNYSYPASVSWMGPYCIW